MKTSIKNIIGCLIFILAGAVPFLALYKPDWVTAFVIITIAFCIYFIFLLKKETFATGDVFCFKNGSQFKYEISKLIASKVDACIKLDEAQRKVLQSGAYNLFVIESGQKIIKELRLTFDLSARASSEHLGLTAMQSIFAQEFNSSSNSKLVYFQNLPKESIDSLNEMLGKTMH
jgi:hypothetical protein